MSFFSLYFRESDISQERAAALLAAVLENAGYARFDPFNGVPGRSYPLTAKLFAAPALNGWVRVLAESVSDELLGPVSEDVGLVYARLQGDSGAVEAWRSGGRLDLQAEFSIMPENVTVIQPPAPQSGWMESLPDEVKAMQRHPKQAAKMIDRLSGSLLAKAGGADQREQAMALLSASDDANWASADGKAILAAFAGLGIQNGVSPDFVTLREAYALHARRKRRPGSSLLPGDENTLQAVPDALNYLPIYAGKG